MAPGCCWPQHPCGGRDRVHGMGTDPRQPWGCAQGRTFLYPSGLCRDPCPGAGGHGQLPPCTADVHPAPPSAAPSPGTCWPPAIWTPKVPGDDAQRCPPTSAPTGGPVGRVGIFRDRPHPRAAPCPQAGTLRPPRFSPPSLRWLGLSRAPRASGSILPIALSSLLINYGSSRKLLLH